MAHLARNGRLYGNIFFHLLVQCQRNMIRLNRNFKGVYKHKILRHGNRNGNVIVADFGIMVQVQHGGYSLGCDRSYGIGAASYVHLYKGRNIGLVHQKTFGNHLKRNCQRLVVKDRHLMEDVDQNRSRHAYHLCHPVFGEATNHFSCVHR